MCRVSGDRTIAVPRLLNPIEFRLIAKAVLGSVIGRTHIRLSPATWAEPPGRVHFWAEGSSWAGTSNWFRLRKAAFNRHWMHRAIPRGCNLNMPLSGPLQPRLDLDIRRAGESKTMLLVLAQGQSRNDDDQGQQEEGVKPLPEPPYREG
jgi:hypothetical protein